MKKIYVDQKKELEFAVSTANVHPDDLSGKIYLNIDEMQWGFNISIGDGKLKASIPPLEDFVNENLLVEGKEIEARIDVIANKTTLTPWKEKMQMIIPKTAKKKVAEIQEMLNTVNTDIILSLTNEKDEFKPKEDLNENIDKEDEIEENLKEDKEEKSKKSKFRSIFDLKEDKEDEIEDLKEKEDLKEDKEEKPKKSKLLQALGE